MDSNLSKNGSRIINSSRNKLEVQVETGVKPQPGFPKEPPELPNLYYSLHSTVYDPLPKADKPAEEEEVDRQIFKDHTDYTRYQRQMQNDVNRTLVQQINSKPKPTKLEIYKMKLKERYNVDELKSNSAPNSNLNYHNNNFNAAARNEDYSIQQNDNQKDILLPNSNNPEHEELSIINKHDLSYQSPDLDNKFTNNHASDVINSIGKDKWRQAIDKDTQAKELKEQIETAQLRKKKEKEQMAREDERLLKQIEKQNEMYKERNMVMSGDNSPNKEKEKESPNMLIKNEAQKNANQSRASLHVNTNPKIPEYEKRNTEISLIDNQLNQEEEINPTKFNSHQPNFTNNQNSNNQLPLNNLNSSNTHAHIQPFTPIPHEEIHQVNKLYLNELEHIQSEFRKQREDMANTVQELKQKTMDLQLESSKYISEMNNLRIQLDGEREREKFSKQLHSKDIDVLKTDLQNQKQKLAALENENLYLNRNLTQKNNVKVNSFKEAGKNQFISHDSIPLSTSKSKNNLQDSPDAELYSKSKFVKIEGNNNETFAKRESMDNLHEIVPQIPNSSEKFENPNNLKTPHKFTNNPNPNPQQSTSMKPQEVQTVQQANQAVQITLDTLKSMSKPSYSLSSTKPSVKTHSYNPHGQYGANGMTNLFQPNDISAERVESNHSRTERRLQQPADQQIESGVNDISFQARGSKKNSVQEATPESHLHHLWNSIKEFRRQEQGKPHQQAETREQPSIILEDNEINQLDEQPDSEFFKESSDNSRPVTVFKNYD